MAFDLEEIDRLLTTTKSVRRRLDLTRPVPRQAIVDCIALGNYAPNASNLQQWRWLVIDDRPTCEAIGEQYRRVTVPAVTELLNEKLARGDEKGARISRSILYLADHMGEVPAIVIPCFDMSVDETTPLPQISRMFGSIYPSVWSFQLALRSRGLGSVFTTAHTLDEAAMGKILGIPDVSCPRRLHDRR